MWATWSSTANCLHDHYRHACIRISTQDKLSINVTRRSKTGSKGWRVPNIAKALVVCAAETSMICWRTNSSTSPRVKTHIWLACKLRFDWLYKLVASLHHVLCQVSAEISRDTQSRAATSRNSRATTFGPRIATLLWHLRTWSPSTG